MHDTHSDLLKAAERFAICARLSARNASEGELECELREMLSVIGEQAEWRIFVDGTRNLGHQASTVVMMRRLIQLTGFTGRIVVVYADHGKAILGSTVEKLALMFTGLDPARMDETVAIHDRCKDIRFLAYERRSELRDPVAFGFTGGADDMSVNYALELKVCFFARIQPYLWDDEPSARSDPYYETSRIEQANGRHLYPVDAYPALRHLPVQHAPDSAACIDPAVWHWYGDIQTFDVDLACRTRNMRSVYSIRHCERATDERAVELWPLYGLQHFRDDMPQMFLVCVLGALRLQMVRRRPIVLVSFSPHEELPGWSELIEALARDIATGEPSLPALCSALRYHDGGPLDEPLLSKSCLQTWACALGSCLQVGTSRGSSLSLHRAYEPSCRQWMDISEPLRESLARTSGAQVHMVELGRVPMDIFHHCLVNGDIPGVIEGQAASNLMSGLGRPFLQVLRPEHVIKNGYAAMPGQGCAPIAEEAASAAELIRHLAPTRWLSGNSDAKADRYLADLDRIVRFIEQATADADNELLRYFESMRHRFSCDAHDKLLVALLALREVVRAQDDNEDSWET